MRTEPLLDESHPERGPRWRVAVVRTGGRAARPATGDVLSQFRAANCMASEVDVPRADPFLDHLDEWAGRVPSDAYDLIAVVGDVSPAVVALAVLVDAPLVSVPVTAEPSLLSAIEDALAAGRLDVVPVARVTLDGDRRFSTRTVTVVPDSDATVRWTGGSGGRCVTAAGCEIRATGGADGLLELCIGDGAPTSCRSVEVTHPDLAVRVDVDARSRRVRNVVVDGVPQGVRILRLGCD